MKEFNKKIIAIVVVFAILLTSFSPVFAKKAEAQWIDISNAAKDYGLDGIAFLIINKIIERISASTVKWINTGFKGKPAFVTNPQAFFKKTADDVVGQFIFENPELNQLCGPINARIKLALTRTYLNEPNYACNLTDIMGNMEDFMNDFERGGWDKFFIMTQNSTQNPMGAYLEAEGTLFKKVENKVDLTNKDLLQGKGFLSKTECIPGTEKVEGGCEKIYADCQAGVPDEDTDTLKQCSDAYDSCRGRYTDAVKVGDCPDEDKMTVTPGSTIESRLNDALGSAGGRLNVADEINEIVGALLSQLVNQVMGGIGGLFGASRPSAETGPSLTERLNESSHQSATSTVDYFGNTADTSGGNYSNYFDTNGTAAGQPSVRPLDKDCSSINDATLTSMAQSLKINFENGSRIFTSMVQFSSLGMYAGESLSEIIRNMDCPPPGIQY